MMWRLLFLLLPGMAFADSVVATRPIRAQSVITAQDIALVPAEIPGALTDLALAIGQEARAAIYPGRPVRTADIGAPALVDRNQTVTLSFRSGGLIIVTEGRALARGGVGDAIKVMNLASHSTLTGIVTADGGVHVGP